MDRPLFSNNLPLEALNSMSNPSQRVILTEGCDGCEHLPQCGGLITPDWFGCFDRCRNRVTPPHRDVNGEPLTGLKSRTKPQCATGSCDWTCPNNPDIFAERWAEVGGLFDFGHETYLPLNGDSWPHYIPMIRSGPPRTKPLNCTFVALSLYESLRFLKGKRGGYESPGRVEFRRRLALRDDCRILLIGVGPDAMIEGFYAKFRDLRLAEVIADLDVVAITPPNFSFFLDVPRPHSLYNRKRMLRVADEFLRHGVQVAPHFNAATTADWDFWAELLRDSPELSVYCKEFQTGNRRKVHYERTVGHMNRLQDQIGRALHPLLVAGKNPMPGLLQNHPSFTVIDSDPSMKTNHRQIFSRGQWRTIRAKADSCLTQLLDHNIAVRAGAIQQQLTRSISAASQSTVPAPLAPHKTPVLELERFVSLTSRLHPELQQ